MKIFRQFYDWTLNKANHPKAGWFLSVISFAESSFFPIPPDIILIPMILAKRAKAWLYALICTASSVAGGILGYVIGFFFYNSVGAFIVNYYSLQNQFSKLSLYYEDYGILIVFLGGFTPFPFKIITIASGFFGLNIFLFVLIAFLARGLRFFLVATLLRIFGNLIKKTIDKYFNILTLLFFILFIGGFLVIKYL